MEKIEHALKMAGASDIGSVATFSFWATPYTIRSKQKKKKGKK